MVMLAGGASLGWAVGLRAEEACRGGPAWQQELACPASTLFWREQGRRAARNDAARGIHRVLESGFPDDDAERYRLCGCVGEFRRCDTFDDPCPQLMGCSASAEVCRARELPEFSDSCNFTVQPSDGSFRPPGGDYCSTGKLCATPGVSAGSADLPFAGSCMTRTYCDEVASADPPVDGAPRCVYSDGQLYIQGPPGGACPTSVDTRTPFCGGSCGDETLCPTIPVAPFPDGFVRGSCVGLSDSRPFGVCAISREYCLRSDPPGVASMLASCEFSMGEACACLVPHRADETDPVGFLTTARVCQQYFGEAGFASCQLAGW